jgi:hypothetical protein
MLIGEELILGIEQYGRWNIQGIVARSQDMMDVLTYLRAERILEMFKGMSFVTIDSVRFERKTDLWSPPMESKDKGNVGSSNFIDRSLHREL